MVLLHPVIHARFFPRRCGRTWARTPWLGPLLALVALAGPPSAEARSGADAVNGAPLHRRLLQERVATGSVSLGTPIRGRLFHPAVLPASGPHHVLLPRVLARHTQFGTDELVALLRYAAREVARRYPGARLAVGNIAKRRGGWIRYSRSHQSGRDADLSFYLRYRGRPITPRRFWVIGPSLHARALPALTFDVPRNWALVRALLSHSSIQVQWIIVAPHLERALLDYARRHQAPRRLLARARQVLHQPLGIRPHNNHFHVRIYCALDDRLVGCRDLPPIWPGVRTFERELRVRVRELLPGLSDKDPLIRRRIMRWIERLDPRRCADLIATSGLTAPDRWVRKRVLRLLIAWRSRQPQVVDAVRDLIQRAGPGARPRRRGAHRPSGRWDAFRTATQIRQAYRLLARIRTPAAVRVLRSGLTSARLVVGGGKTAYRLPEALLAAHAAGGQTNLTLVPRLIDVLDQTSPAVRRQALRALRRLTNHALRGPRSRAARRRTPRRKRQDRQQRWRAWWQRHRGLHRDQLLRLGFAQARPGFNAFTGTARLAALVRFTRRADYLGDNAQATLQRLAGPRVFRAAPPRKGRYRYWRRWLRRYLAVRLGRPLPARRPQLPPRPAGTPSSPETP